MRARGAPQRTCIGCRQVRPKAELLRLVRRPDGVVVPDATGPGRGAYVCRREACLAEASRPGRLARAFRKPSEAGQELANAARAASPGTGRASEARAR